VKIAPHSVRKSAFSGFPSYIKLSLEFKSCYTFLDFQLKNKQIIIMLKCEESVASNQAPHEDQHQPLHPQPGPGRHPHVLV